MTVDENGGCLKRTPLQSECAHASPRSLSPSKRMILALGVLQSVLGSINIANGGEGEPTVAAVANGWKKHQSELNVIRVVWHQQTTDATIKAAIAVLTNSKTAKRSTAKEEAQAPSTVIFDNETTLWLDGDSLVLTQDMDDAQAAAIDGGKAALPRHTKTTVKGDEKQSFSKLSENRRSVATVGPRSDFTEGQRRDIRPLMLALRPLTPTLSGIDLTSYRISAKRPTVNGIICLVLESKRDDDFRTSYWVDPARDYLIVRVVVWTQGRETGHTDIRYQQDHDHVWIPKEWDVIGLYSTDGAFHYSIHAVASTVLLNEPIPSSEFSFELPVGTELFNNQMGQVIHSRVGEQPGATTTSRSSRFWLVVVNLVVLLCIFGYVALRRLRRRPR